MSNSKKAVIIGAGPAGLTAAYELLKHTDYQVLVLEEMYEIGGISRTINHNGNRIDIGGHRFFSKNERVMQWWTSFLPVQGAQAKDDKVLSRRKELKANGPDPECDNGVMLIRDRISRIYYLRKFFDYPISLKLQTFFNLGLLRTLKAGCSYMKSLFFKVNECSLEDFMINRFGKTLYHLFFENYTEKVWGIHPSKISKEWGAQRIKGLSLSKAILNFFSKILTFNSNNLKRKVETSLIEQFYYPKYGPGQLWEVVSEAINALGGKVLLGCKVIRVNTQNKRIKSLIYMIDGEEKIIEGDVFLSSMPICDLIRGFSESEVPKNVQKVAKGLPYRDFITVGILVKKLAIKNETNIRTINNIIPDCWIYVQEADVKVGRIQIFNNWSPYMVNDNENTVWVGLEYFCNEGDSFWSMGDKSIIKLAIQELYEIGIVDSRNVLDSVCVRVKKAYPAYFGTYQEFDEVKYFINMYENLYCIGRNGQHRYNNMDHSMLSAFETVDNIINSRSSKENIWSVNTEEEYHEVKNVR